LNIGRRKIKNEKYRYKIKCNFKELKKYIEEKLKVTEVVSDKKSNGNYIKN